MKELLIATNNSGKQVEIQDILGDLEIRLLTPKQLGITLDVEENGQTYAENALLKAHAFFKTSQLLTLADDSGLEVDALEGQPGLHSARFSLKPGASDADRRTLLLQKLTAHSRPWTARFRCVVALVGPGDFEFITQGACSGEIIPQERGENGFGYDPIFFLPGLNCSMAELPMQRKNTLSHRALALIALRPWLLEWLQKA